MPRNYNFHHPIDASMHYNRAIICLTKAFNTPDGSYLFYAALELRISIERLLFEYLVLVGADEEKIESIMNVYRIKDLSKAIYETEPEFDKKLEYTNFYLKIIGFDFEALIPDKNKLNSYYGKLGSYLHNFKKPVDSNQNQDWWNNFIQFIEETRAYLFEYFKVPRGFFKMNQRGLELYEAYKNNSISKEEIKKRILEAFK
ncbi:MAG: hypothetical protein ABI638_12200 [Ignavibacteriota bacterium]